SAGRPTRSCACLRPPGRDPSRRIASLQPSIPFGDLGGQQPLVLALLPLDPGEVVGAGEPAVDGLAELGLAPEPRGEDEVGDLEPMRLPQLGERPELVQLAEAVLPVAGRGAAGRDEAEAVEVA